jgi:hypothetical protein
VSEARVVPDPSAGPGRLQGALSVLNAVVGDYLRRRSNPLAIDLALYQDGRPLPCSGTRSRGRIRARVLEERVGVASLPVGRDEAREAEVLDAGAAEIEVYAWIAACCAGKGAQEGP